VPQAIMVPAPTAPEQQEQLVMQPAPSGGASPALATPAPKTPPARTSSGAADPCPSAAASGPATPAASGGTRRAVPRARVALTAVLLVWCIVATFMAACDWQGLLLLSPDTFY
jgi:hypothetical protein